jgi:hypothetical protein
MINPLSVVLLSHQWGAVQFGPPSKVAAGGIRQFPPVSAGRCGADRPIEAFADALDIVEESDAPENGRGFPPFPVFPPVRVDARETCERWNMLRSCCGMEGRGYAVF